MFVKIPGKANREDIHPGVELGLTGPTPISTNIRTTCSKSLAVFVSNDSSLSVRPRILFVVELAIAEMACVSSNVPFLSALRSGLLTFFSSLVIQESLINFAGERRRSRMTSHCELILSFCLSASYPVVGIKFFALIFPCYDVSIAKAMDYTTKENCYEKINQIINDDTTYFVRFGCMWWQFNIDIK